MPDPLYTRENTNFAWQLKWSLTLFWKQPAPTDTWFYDLRTATELDGLRLLEVSHPTSECTQFLSAQRLNCSRKRFPGR